MRLFDYFRWKKCPEKQDAKPIDYTDIEQSKQWFKEAKFGMFVHWGLYSIPAGVWKEREVPFLGEWIMHTARIPSVEYRKLASRFNPVKFDAKRWVRLAEDAGMKYLVFTAKHHDGFAMFKSEADRYNIVDAAPFKRDVVAELADACNGTDVRLALYYSQAMDWNEAHGCNAICDQGYGNNWDFRPGTPEGFAEYIERKSKPQIKELLTQYGPVAMMWFDNPMPSFTREHAIDVKNLVRSLQPGCLISQRIGHRLGDIRGFGDNDLPEEDEEGLSEACITMNDTWGYKHNSGAWKSAEEIIDMKRYTNDKGSNLLLNVGPMKNGAFPPQAIRCLEDIARLS